MTTDRRATTGLTGALWVVPLVVGTLILFVRSEHRDAPLTAGVAWVALMSCGAAYLFWADKRRAREGRDRVPEAVLWRFVVFGGALGAWVAMRRWRHKTRTSRFRIGVPVLAVLHVLAIVALAFHI